MKRVFASFIFFAPPLLAMTDELTILKSPTNQPIFLSGGDHTYRNDYSNNPDRKYFEGLVERVREADDEAEKHELTAERRSDARKIPFYIFIEEEACKERRFSVDGKIIASIQHGLVDYYCAHPFKRSVVISCEVRKKSAAAIDIFYTAPDDPDPLITKQALQYLLEQSKKREPLCVALDKKFYGCQIHEVTFKDLINEFERLEKETIQYRDHWKDNPEIQERFDVKLRCSRDFFEDVREFIEKNKCENKSILEYVIEQLIPYPKTRNFLGNFIGRSFCDFVDAFILHNILLLQKKPVAGIIAFTGAGHTSRLEGDFKYGNTAYKEIQPTKTFLLSDLDELKKPVSVLEAERSWLRFCILL